MYSTQQQHKAAIDFACHRAQVVSDAFAGKPLVARHRLIYSALAEELQAGLHALQLSTKTPTEVGR
jgi:BolA protein